MNIKLTKTLNGFVPSDAETNEWFEKLTMGQVVHADFKKMRNYKFHKKFFTLLAFSYQYWLPGEIDSKWGVPEKNPEQFRKNVTILAGYYTMVINIDGSVSPKAKSISFANMEQEEFDKLYNAVLTVLMKKILVDMSIEEVEDLTDKFLSFA